MNENFSEKQWEIWRKNERKEERKNIKKKHLRKKERNWVFVGTTVDSKGRARCQWDIYPLGTSVGSERLKLLTAPRETRVVSKKGKGRIHW